MIVPWPIWCLCSEMMTRLPWEVNVQTDAPKVQCYNIFLQVWWGNGVMMGRKTGWISAMYPQNPSPLNCFHELWFNLLSFYLGYHFSIGALCFWSAWLTGGFKGRKGRASFLAVSLIAAYYKFNRWTVSFLKVCDHHNLFLDSALAIEKFNL